ncbi:MAG TPA: aminotransferase class I/II-fold pyridoxal phosphate-dependent enzyme [Acidobacteriota bacterium]|nr:aminotransferase class I/II-fold pyridoxal phosphate-dependent enzyme [Acidobacteriota bacterium]
MKPKIETISAHKKKVEFKNEPVALPIYQTSTFRFGSVEDLEKHLDGDETQYQYTRYENPTLRAVQEKIAELEKGDRCYVFSSGMAAITSSMMAFLNGGDELLASNSLYGRTQLFIENWLPRFGVKTRQIPVEEFPEVDRYFTPKTKILYIESPTNPTCRIIDIKGAAECAHRHNALLLIDNTFASPVNQNPIELGADVVLHSLTKYIGGHTDLIAGASIFADRHEKQMRETIRTFGGTLDPLAAFLIERGIKTLPIRVQRQNATTQWLAQRCSEHPKIKRVNYPGLANHPQHAIAAKQMRGFGGMFSFDLADYDQARRFISRMKLVQYAASLGGPETLATLPVLSSHYAQPEANLAAAGISRGTIRISVGLEDPGDIWQDFEQAMV